MKQLKLNSDSRLFYAPAPSVIPQWSSDMSFSNAPASTASSTGLYSINLIVKDETAV